MTKRKHRRPQQATQELFKYRAITDTTLSFLRSGDVYFSSPEELNDPFDCRYVNRDLSEEWDRFERERMSGNDADRLSVAEARRFERSLREGTQKTRIYCLSEAVDSVLMWSHYSNSHRGICVCLKAEASAGFLSLPFEGRSFDLSGYASIRGRRGRIKHIGDAPAAPSVVRLLANAVLYQDSAPGFFQFYTKDDGSVGGVTFELVKHASWTYERERRLVVNASMLRENPVHIDKEAISGIVFGLKTSLRDVALVLDAIRARLGSRSITYSRMVPATDGVGLTRVAIPDIDEYVSTSRPSVE